MNYYALSYINKGITFEYLYSNEYDNKIQEKWQDKALDLVECEAQDFESYVERISKNEYIDKLSVKKELKVI